MHESEIRKGIEKRIQPPTIEAPETQILYLGVVKHSLLFRGLRASRLPPLWDCFWAFLNKGLVKKSII